jgi:hypothetical protein
MSKRQHVATPDGKVWQKLKMGEWITVEDGPVVYKDSQAKAFLSEGLKREVTSNSRGMLWRLADVVPA